MNHLLKTILLFLVLTASAYAEPQTKVLAQDALPATPTPAQETLPAAPLIEPQSAAPIEEPQSDVGKYLLSPGDLLEITVWKEEGLQQQQTLVAPDGNITFPFAGTLMAAGKPISTLQKAIAGKMSAYIADPVVNIKLLQNNGNTIFVIGKVNKPGQFPANRRIDVMQALSLAGGLTVFADDSSINVLRRVGDEIKVFPFDYGYVLNGEHLEQNIILEAGDTVTVP